MQISRINYNFKPYYNRLSSTPQPVENPQPDNNAQNLNFDGFSFKYKKQYGKFFLSEKNENNIKFFFNDLSYFINADRAQIQKYAKVNKHKRMDFCYDLAHKMYLDVHKNAIPLPENRFEILDELYNAVPDPHSFHFKILRNKNYTFEDAVQLIKAAQSKKENLSLITKLQSIEDCDRNNTRFQLSAADIINLVQSPQAAKLNENFADYRSYITINQKKPDFIPQLLEELNKEKPSFDPKALDQELKLKNLRFQTPLLKKLPTETILNNWNEEGFKLFQDNSIPSAYFMPKGRDIDKQDIPFYEFLINTTTKDNLETRKTFFKNFSGLDTDGNTPEAITEFLTRVDEDKNFKKIFDAASESHIADSGITKLMFYVDKFGSDILAPKAKRFINLLEINRHSSASPDELTDILSKNLNNKFYASDHKIHYMQQDEMLALYSHRHTGDIRANIMRAKRKLRYELMPKLFGTGKPIPVKNNIDFNTYNARFTQAIPTEATQTLPVKTAQAAPAQTASFQAVPAKPVIKRDYKAKKLEVQKDAQEIIKSRMKSAKQIQDQIGDYTKRATKMRNQFLNEMFNSVAETRAQQRAQGIKRPTISNEDVLEVYQKINGKNKKLFKYLLNSRKENGEREFNLKQISQILDEVKAKRPSN